MVSFGHNKLHTGGGDSDDKQQTSQKLFDLSNSPFQI
jgi:hypothetical protein